MGEGARLYDQEEDKAAVSLLLNWFRQLALYGKVAPEDYAQLDYVYRTKEEVRTMLVATLEKERKKIYQAGREEGREEGLKAQRTTLLQVLQWRFQPAEQEQSQLARQLAQIKDLAQLSALVNVVLQIGNLAEFIEKLKPLLPSPQSDQQHTTGQVRASD